jgi:hypothetical protein
MIKFRPTPVLPHFSGEDPEYGTAESSLSSPPKKPP